MTQSRQIELDLSDDATISAAVSALLHDSGESVADLAYHTRISTAALYRKLGGQVAWRASDIGAVARRYRIRPGALFYGPDVLQHCESFDQAEERDEKRPRVVRHQGLEPRTRWFGVSADRDADVIELDQYRRPTPSTTPAARAAGHR